MVSSEAKDLISKMLTYKYTERISAREALNNKWFANAPEAQVDSALMAEAMQNLSKFSAT